MKQKYIIKKDDAKSTLIIKEYAELDKEIMSFMGEHEYGREDITRAIAGDDELVNVLRSNDFYPPRIIADKIAEKITEIYDTDINEAVELLLNDVDFLEKDEPKEETIVPEIEEHVDDGVVDVVDVVDDEDDVVDDLLEDSLSDSKSIGDTSTFIKSADDETLDGDIEVDSEA